MLNESVLSFLKIREAYFMGPVPLTRLIESGNTDDFYIVDVRNPGGEKTIKNRIKGAIFIPQNQIENRMGELDKSKTVILYCWDDCCTLAYRAAIVLLENGFKNVKELMGGIQVWEERHLPVEAA